MQSGLQACLTSIVKGGRGASFRWHLFLSLMHRLIVVVPGCAIQALKNNNKPYADHGIEVMYRFAAFDPFERSKYFG